MRPWPPSPPPKLLAASDSRRPRPSWRPRAGSFPPQAQEASAAGLGCFSNNSPLPPGPVLFHFLGVSSFGRGGVLQGSWPLSKVFSYWVLASPQLLLTQLILKLGKGCEDQPESHSSFKEPSMDGGRYNRLLWSPRLKEEAEPCFWGAID